MIFSFGNISMTVRPSLAARTKSRPPERIRAIAGMPTVRSMSATETPLLARLTTSDRRSADAELGGEVAELDGGAERGHVRRDRHEDPVGLLEEGLVERAVRRMQVDDDEVEAASRDGDRVGDALRLEDLGVAAATTSATTTRMPDGWADASSMNVSDGPPSGSSRQLSATVRTASMPSDVADVAGDRVGVDEEDALALADLEVAARFVATVVLPTPPFGLKTTMTVARRRPAVGLDRAALEDGPMPSSTVWLRMHMASTRQRSDSAE